VELGQLTRVAPDGRRCIHERPLVNAVRYTDRIRRDSDHSSSGLLRLLEVHRGVPLLRTIRIGSGGGACLGTLISSAATNEEQEHLAAAPIGVIRIRSASGPRGNWLSRPAARRRSHVDGRLAQHSFDERSRVTVVARFDCRAGSHRFGPPQSVVVAPLCG
jgi:hypothetical protein